MNINLNIKKLTILFLVLLIIALSVYFFLRRGDKKPLYVASKSDYSIIQDLSKLVELPTNEKPTVATVSNLELLKNQPFFANAKVGDKVFIYTNTKKAIIYRPSDNIIVDMAPLDMTPN